MLLESHCLVVKFVPFQPCKDIYFELAQANVMYSGVSSLLHAPQMKQVVFRISSFLCFSLLKSANVSMMTPKIRLRTIMMTTKKKRRS